MATQKSKRPLRPWNITSLLVLGQREGVKANYLKAIPVIILEKWVRHGKIEDKANFISTDELAERLEESGLRQNLKGKRNGVLLGSLSTIQNSRNLKDPPLIEYRGAKGDAMFWVNLTHYEPLLQEYRKKYRELLPEDYKKLFPIPKEEPDWESPSLSSAGQVFGEAKPTHPESEVQAEIPSLLAQVEQAWRDQQQAVIRLTEENRKLQAEQRGTNTSAFQNIAFLHTSPDFHRSGYNGKVTSIKDTIANMLKRAEHTIRISTRQMDMFTDELIALKRRRPDMEIVVLSRGPLGAEGDRKRLAGVAFDRMKQAGIKLPVEKDTLHSRIIVIDTKEVLASSADLDFTHMDLEFNAGIWTSNPEVVAEAIRYFDNLLGLSQGG